MNKHIEDLKKAAKAIGYEKWITDGAGEVATVDYVGEDGVITGDHVCNCEAVNGESENATFIALANPARILDLIRQLEAAEKERDEFRRSYENAHTEWHEAQENYDSAKRELTLVRHHVKTLQGTVDIVNQQRDHWMERAKAAEVRGLDVIRDANRYRFLRDEDSWGEDSNSWDVETRTGLISSENLMELRLDHFDAAIDARMAASDIPFLNPVTSVLSTEDSEWKQRAEAAEGQVNELKVAALVPGVLHCAKCNFQLSKTNLYMKSGTTGPGDNKTEPCPNGCGPLWPVTWHQWAFDASAAADKYFDELKAAEKERGQLRKQLEAADNELEAERQLTAEITEQYVDRTTALSFATRRAEAAEARLPAPSDETLCEVIRAWNRADIPRNAYPEMRKALGYPVEGGE